MGFDKPHTTVVETRLLRKVLTAVDNGDVKQARALLEKLLGLDQPKHECMD